MNDNMTAAHRAALDAYLGSVRSASEEFFAAYREQTEALRRLTAQIEDAAAGAGGQADTPADTDTPGARSVPVPAAAADRLAGRGPALFNPRVP